MMKLFQHVNIQPCLAAFAADMEVNLFWQSAVENLFIHAQKVWLVTPLMPYGSVADLVKAHFQVRNKIIIKYFAA